MPKPSERTRPKKPAARQLPQAPPPPEAGPEAPAPARGRRARRDAARQRALKDRQAKHEELERQVKALSPANKKDLARVNRFVTGFFLVTLVAMIALALPLPWPAVGLAAVIAGAAVAVRGIMLARKTPLGSGAVMYLSLGLALLGMFTLYSIPQVATWEDQWAYQECLEQTQTIEGQDACLAAYEEATKADWTRLIQPARR